MGAATRNEGADPSRERDLWRARYRDVRAHTQALAAPLSPADQAIQSMPDVSPTKWHLAHTAWFFEEFVLRLHAPFYAPADPQFGYLFNSYYEAVGPRHPRAERGLISRPSADEVRAYRAHVDCAMDRLLAQADDARWPEICGLLDIGLNHEQQHQELILMDIKHVLSCNPLQPAYDGAPRAQTSTPAQMDWLAFPGGLYHIGHSGRDGLGFAFDNEGPQHRVWLEPFKLASRLVTCGEYLGFIEDDGYQRPEFWLSDGWRTVADRKWRAPLYWDLDARTIFTLSGTRAIDPHEPVCHVSYYEADAYARWAGKRLAREGEWEVAAAQLGGSAGGVHGGFHPQATEGAGLTQMFGETWQWTASAYCAYPGYRPAAGAIGEYNGKFMCGQFVLRGSAAITPRGHGRLTYRNFFPPDARWAFSGVRLADDDA